MIHEHIDKFCAVMTVWDERDNRWPPIRCFPLMIIQLINEVWLLRFRLLALFPSTFPAVFLSLPFFSPGCPYLPLPFLQSSFPQSSPLLFLLPLSVSLPSAFITPPHPEGVFIPGRESTCVAFNYIPGSLFPAVLVEVLIKSHMAAPFFFFSWRLCLGVFSDCVLFSFFLSFIFFFLVLIYEIFYQQLSKIVTHFACSASSNGSHSKIIFNTFFFEADKFVFVNIEATFLWGRYFLEVNQNPLKFLCDGLDGFYLVCLHRMVRESGEHFVSFSRGSGAAGCKNSHSFLCIPWPKIRLIKNKIYYIFLCGKRKHPH